MTQVLMSDRKISANRVFKGLINELQCAQQVLVGLSGGLDSTVLLTLLVDVLPADQITAVHVNHGLSSEADQWQEHTKKLCENLGVGYHGKTVTVMPTGGGVEEAARKARYQVFQDLMEQDGILLLGHHQNDQAETIVYRLMRGSGPRGLSGIPTSRSIGPGKLYRPLLSWSKQHLMDYAIERQLDFVEDQSNQEVYYDRNFLRHQVVPLLAKRWPDYLQRLNGVAKISQDTDQLCRDLAAQDICGLNLRQERAGASLCIACLKLLSPVRQRNVLRHWPERYGRAALNAKAIDEIIGSVIEARPDACPKVSCNDVEFHRFRRRIYILDSNQLGANIQFEKRQVDWSQLSSEWIDSGLGVVLSRVRGDGIRVRPDQLISLSQRVGGELCHPQGRAHSNSLKKCLQENDVEPWWRFRVPLIYVDDCLAAVGDLWICEGWSVGPEEDGIKIHWRSNSL